MKTKPEKKGEATMITKDIKKHLDGMSEVELITLFGKLEEVRFGIENTFGIMIGGHSFYCNTYRAESPYVIDNKPVSESEFFELWRLVDLELKDTYSLSIHICPPHKRKPKK